MEPRKLTSADIDRVRDIEGFPIATDEAIIELSDAPYYTACPNPFIEEFIAENGAPYDEETDDYHREPFSSDVSEGKNDPIYLAHSYHTKVPYKAIMRYILHYTDPGDIILDGFCGTGQTGVAAQFCGDAEREMQLILDNEVQQTQYGVRNVILNDLSPAATFISFNYNRALDANEFENAALAVIEETKRECQWMYETLPSLGGSKLVSGETHGLVNYIVWSDVMICPHCGNEITFWDVAVNRITGQISDSFTCNSCGLSLSKKDCERAKEVIFDPSLGKTVEMPRTKPVLVNYTYMGQRYEKAPDAYDMELIQRTASIEIPYWHPIDRLPDGDKTSDPIKCGVEYVHQFYTRRTLYVLASLFDKIAHSDYQRELMFVFTGILQISSKMSRFRYDSRNPKNTAGGTLNGTLYIPSLSRESNIFENFSRRLSPILTLRYRTQTHSNGNVCITTGSLENTTIPSESIDYIFTDPPFGANLNYSELSFIWEPWLRVVTNATSEAIMSRKQGKGLVEYQGLMERCFVECYRVLKPGRWMTVEFHNSKNAVWNAIQTALQRSGFIVADVRTIDKKQVSFNQGKGASQAIKQDLVISAYKPKESFTREFMMQAGTEETAWSFVRQHLAQMPVVVISGGKIELISERQAYLLFDRMVAYHIMNGIPVPLDAAEFYKGLDEKFLLRDTMYFLPDQVNEYDTARIVNEVEPIQFSLFVTNEKTAISWLYQQLSEEYGGAQTYAEIQPKFMQEFILRCRKIFVKDVAVSWSE